MRLSPAPNMFLERAKIIRRQAETMSADVRRQLLEIAEKYEGLAYSIERARRGGD